MCAASVDDSLPGAGRGRQVLLSPWLPALLGLACMVNSIGNGLTYDDLPLVRDNPRIRALTDFRGLWLSSWWAVSDQSADVNARQEPLYRPLVLFTFALNYAADGLRPVGFHLVNILLHTAVCFLVWHFVRRLLGDAAVASVTGVLFAVHPIHAEAVAGVVGRAEIMAALFVLVGLLVLMPSNSEVRRYEKGRASDSAVRRSGERGAVPKLGRAVLVMPAFFAALLSKETAVCYPAVALLTLHAMQRGRRQPRRWWLMHAVCLLIPLLVYLPLRYVALEGRLFRPEPAGVVMNPLVMAKGGERVLGAFTVLGHYARLLAVPDRLSCDYGLAIVDPRAGFTVTTLVGLVVAGGMGVGLIGFARRGRRWQEIATLTGMTLASYALISNTVLLIGVSLAERLMYWPSVPILMLGAVGIVEFWRRRCAGGGTKLERSARLLRVLLALFVVALGLRTAVRNADWSDNLSLVGRDVATYPQGAHLNRGYAFELVKLAGYVDDPELQAEWLQEAESKLAAALRIDPAYTDALALRARVRAHLNDIDAAFLYAEAALRLDPHHRDALRVIAQLRGGSGSTQRRLASLRADVEEQPDDPGRRLALAKALLGFGQPGAAREQLERTLALAPDNLEALRLLGEALALAGQSQQAARVFRQVLTRAPDDWRTHANLSRLLAESDVAASLRHAERAYELEPGNQQVMINLAEAYALNRRKARAMELYDRIGKELDEDDPFRKVIEARIAELRRR